MAKRSNVAGAIIGSVLITLILVAAGGYFVLPLVFPNLKAENEDENILLQSKMVEIDSPARRNDTISDFEKMNGTETSIIIEENSRITASFSCTLFLFINPFMVGSLWFEISLVLEGVSNSTRTITTYRESASGDYEQVTISININLMSNELSNGTYNIAVYWRSLLDPIGENFLYTHDVTIVNSRTLWVQELR